MEQRLFILFFGISLTTSLMFVGTAMLCANQPTTCRLHEGRAVYVYTILSQLVIAGVVLFVELRQLRRHFCTPALRQMFPTACYPQGRLELASALLLFAFKTLYDARLGVYSTSTLPGASLMGWLRFGVLFVTCSIEGGIDMVHAAASAIANRETGGCCCSSSQTAATGIASWTELGAGPHRTFI